MRILSLFYGHDANCTLMEDGEPVVVLEKERLTRVKHDKGAMDIGAILEEYGWNPETIDSLDQTHYRRPIGAVALRR
ncbi:MAG: carbamoyltransferase N-terminal domain-containing protein [Desulfobacterales bacterium]